MDGSDPAGAGRGILLSLRRGIASRPGDSKPSLREAVLNLLFPAHCVSCGTGGHWLCPACFQQILFFAPPWPAFVDQVEPLQGIRSAAHFGGPLRQAIHSFKYQGLRALTGTLGQVLYLGWEKEPWPADVIVPVPLHRRRERTRGYNQSALLAQDLAHRLALPVVAGVLQRTVDTAPQVSLNTLERTQNVQEAFCCADLTLSGRSVLLIDDVLTTGATLRACAVALLQGGARDVHGITLAHG
jgi:ComF family protein